MLTTMRNRCPSEISIHFPNWKQNCSSWTIFRTEKWLSINQYISVLPPNLRFVSSFFNKEVVSTSSSLSTQTLSSWTEALPKCLLICSFVGMDMYWRTSFSFLDFITDNVMLDFNCTSVWNTGFLWRLHVALINKVYHCWNTGTYPCGTSFVIMRSDLQSNCLDTISLL